MNDVRRPGQAYFVQHAVVPIEREVDSQITKHKVRGVVSSCQGANWLAEHRTEEHPPHEHLHSGVGQPRRDAAKGVLQAVKMGVSPKLKDLQDHQGAVEPEGTAAKPSSCASRLPMA